MADEKAIFEDIANGLVSDEANDYLDKRLVAVDQWVQYQQERGHPATLRAFIDKLMQEPNERGPVIITLATALWRLREEHSHVER